MPDAISIFDCSALPFVIVLCGLISESEADGGQFVDDDVNFSCLHVPFSEGQGTRINEAHLKGPWRHLPAGEDFSRGVCCHQRSTINRHPFKRQRPKLGAVEQSNNSESNQIRVRVQIAAKNSGVYLQDTVSKVSGNKF